MWHILSVQEVLTNLNSSLIKKMDQPYLGNAYSKFLQKKIYFIRKSFFHLSRLRAGSIHCLRSRSYGNKMQRHCELDLLIWRSNNVVDKTRHKAIHWTFDRVKKTRTFICVKNMKRCIFYAKKKQSSPLLHPPPPMYYPCRIFRRGGKKIISKVGSGEGGGREITRMHNIYPW